MQRYGDTEESVENKMVNEIQKIKKVRIGDSNEEKEKQEQEIEQDKISKSEIQNIKKFLIEEYGVNEKCLQIN